MVVRTKTKEECEAALMLLGPNWSYGSLSHTFIKGEAPGHGIALRITEYRCADTLEVLDLKTVQQRRIAQMVKNQEEALEHLQERIKRYHRR